MRVLGIDPGTRLTGWGLVEPASTRSRHVASGVIRLAPKASIAERLRSIHETLGELVREYRPAALSLEKAFVAENVQSAFRIGEARGAVLIAAAECGVPVFEYAPAEVKLAVVGYGRAGKAQIARGIALLLGIETPASADEADALAVALCHLQGARLRRLVGAAR